MCYVIDIIHSYLYVGLVGAETDILIKYLQNKHIERLCSLSSPGVSIIKKKNFYSALFKDY